VFVQCLLSKEFGWKSKGNIKKKKEKKIAEAEGCSHSWGVEIEYMASFKKKKNETQNIMSRGAENLAGVSGFF